MAIQICWLDNLAKAQETAKTTNKPILLDFFNPQWLGCQQMGAVTYPNEKVAKFLSLNYVPVQIESSNKEMMARYAVSWTPTIIVLDADLREHYRAVGFYTPEDMIATFMAAKGRWALDTDQLPEARTLFEEVISSYPESEAAAMATFFLGVARYKMSHDPKPLRETYDALVAKFPHSAWTKQADHYRLINK